MNEGADINPRSTWSQLMRKLVSSFVFFILLLSGNGWGATYYVDQTGGDNAKNGLSPAFAWKTIAKVNASRFAAGDSILFKRGETWSSVKLIPPSSGENGNRITFGAYGTGNAPVIDYNNTGQYAVEIVGKSYLTIRDLEIKNATFSLVLIQYSPYITIDNCTLHGSGSRAIFSVGRPDPVTWNDYITITNNTIYDIGDWDNSGAADIQLSYYTRRHTITNNVMYGNGVDRGVDGITTDSALSRGSGHIISGNTSYDHQENCYDFKGVGQSAAGEGRTQFFNNICYGSATNGINIAEGSNHIDIGPGNLIYGNDEGGITFIGTTGDPWDNTLGDVDIFYNVIRDNGMYGIVVNNLTLGGDINIFNNVITNNGLPPNIGAGHTGVVIESNGVTLKNNIIHLNAVGRYQGSYYDFAIYASAGVTITSDYNIINTPTGTGGMYYYDGGYRTWSVIRGTYGLETHSITGDPLFTNLAGDDFTLTSSSPAINVGVDVGLTTDYLAKPVPFGSAPDIGAYEYISQYISPKVVSPPAPPANIRIE